MRLHFNLVRGTQRIPDEEGVDVEDLHAGVLEAFETLRAMQEQDAANASSWPGGNCKSAMVLCALSHQSP